MQGSNRWPTDQFPQQSSQLPITSGPTVNYVKRPDPVPPHQTGQLSSQATNGKGAIITNWDLLDPVRNSSGKRPFVRNRHDYFAPGGHESFQKIKQHRFSASKVFCFGMNQQESHRQKIQNSCADLQTRNGMQAEGGQILIHPPSLKWPLSPIRAGQGCRAPIPAFLESALIREFRIWDLTRSSPVTPLRSRNDRYHRYHHRSSHHWHKVD